jgi:leucyl-tRNA synthetase
LGERIGQRTLKPYNQPITHTQLPNTHNPTPTTHPAPERPRRAFDHRAIEAKWQARWEADQLYRAAVDPDRPKYYALVMFPYTSGDLHLGHWWNFALADVHVRYKRMQGYNVLFPPGFDAFGLPAEGAAIKSGTHPYR